MIDPHFFAAFEDEIARISATISGAKQQLDIEEGRDVAGEIRVRITYLEKLRGAMTAGRDTIRAADSKVGEMQQKYLKWRTLAAEARAAEEEMGDLAEKIIPLREACVDAQNVAAVAEENLRIELQTPVHPLATEPEKARKRAAEQKLREEHKNALQNLRDAARARDDAQTAWFSARQKLDAALFTERMNRLPEEPTRERGDLKIMSIG